MRGLTNRAVQSSARYRPPSATAGSLHPVHSPSSPRTRTRTATAWRDAIGAAGHGTSTWSADSTTNVAGSAPSGVTSISYAMAVKPSSAVGIRHDSRGVGVATARTGPRSVRCSNRGAVGAAALGMEGLPQSMNRFKAILQRRAASVKGDGATIAAHRAATPSSTATVTRARSTVTWSPRKPIAGGPARNAQ